MRRAAPPQMLCLVALAAILSGCIPTPPPDPWFTADRFISPADTVKLATLYCECVPYQCDRHPLEDEEARLFAAVRESRGVSMADVALFTSWRFECQTGLFNGSPLPEAGPPLQAFKMTVRPVN